MRIFLFVIACLFASATLATAQVAPAVPPADLAKMVHQEFGPDFELVTASPTAKIVGSTAMGEEPTHWTPLLVGDLDGDGSEDAVIIARNKNAVIGADAYHYKVLDAYNGHFGYGNPQVTASFNNDDPVHDLLLLIINGAGKEGWRAEKPKAKFVLINIPFVQASMAKAVRHKKTIDAIRVEESDTISSLVVWDGKKYKYVPGGATN